MKIEIKEYCIRCGICAGLYPELFAYNLEKDRIDVLSDADIEDKTEIAKNAAKDCAVSAIFINSQ